MKRSVLKMLCYVGTFWTVSKTEKQWTSENCNRLLMVLAWRTCLVVPTLFIFFAEMFCNTIAYEELIVPKLRSWDDCCLKYSSVLDYVVKSIKIMTRCFSLVFRRRGSWNTFSISFFSLLLLSTSHHFQRSVASLTKTSSADNFY